MKPFQILYEGRHVEMTQNGLGHNIGHSVGWVERSETQQLIGVGFRSSTQPTGNPYGLKYDQGPQNRKAVDLWFERHTQGLTREQDSKRSWWLRTNLRHLNITTS